MDTTEPGDDPEVEVLTDEETEGTTEAEDNAELEDDPEAEAEEEDTEPELIDVEHGGKTYKVPAELRDSIMWHDDYTRKTQEVAEQRKALESRITEAAQASEAEMKAQAQLIAIDAALEQYSQVDWEALERQNIHEAQRHFRQFTMLQQQRGTAEQELKGAHETREAEAQRLHAERFEQSMSELKAAIPDWSEPKAVELRNFASQQFGFTDEEFRTGLHDARQIKMLNMAFAASKSLKQKPPVQQQAVKPAAKVKGGSSVPKVGLRDDLSTEEWMKRRSAQLAKR